MTQTLTTERIREISELRIKTLTDGTAICPDAYKTVFSIEISAMARELLANREAQPVASREHFESLCNQFWNWDEFDEINAEEEPRLQWDGKNYTHCVTAALWRMYQAAPPAPAVPNEMPESVYSILSSACGDSACLVADELWNACRAAMLAQPQIEPQNIPNNIPDGLAAAVNRLLDSDGSRGCFSAVRSYDAREEIERLLAQPVSQGCKLVPVEPTAEMIQSGIAAHYERQQLQIHDWPAPGPMECAYIAMLAAAPEGGNGA